MSSIIEQSGIATTLEPIFQGIHELNWNQQVGCIYAENFDSHGQLLPGFACCVGAHIAKFLDIWDESGDDDILYHYSDGRDYVLEQLQQIFPEMNYYMMCAIFHCAGSPPNPFNAEDWEFEPSIVLQNMKYIENMPPIADTRLFLLEYYKTPEFLDWFAVERYRIVVGNWARKQAQKVHNG